MTWTNAVRVMAAMRKAISPSSRRSSQRIDAFAGGRVRGAGLLVGLEGRVDQVAADVGLELLPHRLHGRAPGCDVLLRELLDLRLAGIGDALLVRLVDVVGDLVAVGGGFR